MVDMNARDISLSSLIVPGMSSTAAEDALSHVDVLHGGWGAADEALAQYSTLDPAQRLAIKVCCCCYVCPVVFIAVASLFKVPLHLVIPSDSHVVLHQHTYEEALHVADRLLDQNMTALTVLLCTRRGNNIGQPQCWY